MMHKTQVQVDQRLQNKSSYTEADKTESGSSLESIDTGDFFLSITPVAQRLGLTINKGGLLKLKNLRKAKDTVNKTRWQLTEWEKIFTTPTSDRGLNKNR